LQRELVIFIVSLVDLKIHRGKSLALGNRQILLRMASAKVVDPEFRENICQILFSLFTSYQVLRQLADYFFKAFLILPFASVVLAQFSQSGEGPSRL